MQTTTRKPDTGVRVIDSRYGDPRLTRTDLNCFQRYPERSSWIDYEVREYPDGTTVRWERSCGRWSSVYSTGEWRVAGERQAAILRGDLAMLRTYAALFLFFDDMGDNPERKQPSPPLKLASRPGLGAETWRKYLVEEARKAPRAAPEGGAA